MGVKFFSSLDSGPHSFVPQDLSTIEVINTVEDVNAINSGEFNRVLQQHWLRPTSN